MERASHRRITRMDVHADLPTRERSTLLASPARLCPLSVVPGSLNIMPAGSATRNETI